MIDYRMQRRLSYIGGGIQAQMSAWPAGGEWWEPSGTFTCVAAYQAKGAASLAASYVNLANPGTYDAAPGVAPTFDAATGWTFGSAQYLLSNITTAGKDWTFIVKFSLTGSPTNLHRIINKSDGVDYIFMQPVNGTNRGYIHSNGAPVMLIAGAITSGSHVMAMAGRTAYLDGSAETGTLGDRNVPSGTIMLGGNGAATALNGSVQAVAIYSTTLDATQMGEITTNMQAL